MSVDWIVSAIAGRAIEDMHPDDVEHWRGVVYTVLTLAQAELPTTPTLAVRPSTHT